MYFTAENTVCRKVTVFLTGERMKKRKTNRAKRVDKACKNHGSCPHCRGNRLYQAKREMEKEKHRETEKPLE